VARRLTGDPGAATTLTVAAIGQALASPGPPGGRAGVRVWLLRLLFEQHAAGRGRDRAAAVVADLRPGLDPDEEPVVELPGRRLGGPRPSVPSAAAAIALLPEGLRGCVVLVDLHGLGPAEAGEVLGLAPEVVLHQLAQAHRRLRDLLVPGRAGADAL
jgi:DNA-directed RNA polymerase specialized sigma24 family protein